MKKLLILIVLLFIAVPSFAENWLDEYDLTLEEKARIYVYMRTDIYDWNKNNPPTIGIEKGSYRQPGHPKGDFLRFGKISGETWDSLGLKGDKIYKKGENVIIERNVCILPNWKINTWTTPDKGNYKEYTKGAKLVRIRETATPSRDYSSEIVEVITDDPPLMEIFHWESDQN